MKKQLVSLSIEMKHTTIFCFLVILLLQACATDTPFIKRELSTLSPLEVAHYETPPITKNSGGAAFFTGLGGIGGVLIAESIRKSGGKKAQEHVVDYLDLVTKKFAERVPAEIPNWPAMTVIEKPISNDHSKTSKNLIEFKIHRPWGGVSFVYGSFGIYGKGLWTHTLATLKDVKGNVLWQRYFPYISSDFNRGKDAVELEADDFALLKDEIEFAAEKTVDDFISHFKQGDNKQTGPPPQVRPSGGKKEARVEKALLVKEISKGVNPAPTEEIRAFSQKDKQAVMRIELKELEGRHTLKWDWYDPAGKLYLTTGDYNVNTDGKHRKSNASWHKMAIKDEKAASLPGRWSVKVSLDGIPVASKEFEIKKGFDLNDIGRAQKVKPDRRKWAVVIGIERYRKTAPVQFAERDARTVRDYLNNYLGVPEENTITFINEMATKAELEVMIKDRLRGLMREGDTLYLYYAGHGIPADDTPYLLPHDGDPDSPAITAYSVDALYKDIDQLPAGNIFIFLDTCFSGRVGREEKETILMAGARPGILKVKDPLLLSKKIVAMSAARSNQLSNYYKEEGHGLFTYYLLKGLLGDADNNGDSKIQMKELSGYVEEEVGAASRRLFGLSRQQNPVSMPKPLADKEEAVIVEVITR